MEMEKVEEEAIDVSVEEVLGVGFDWTVKTNAQRELEGFELDWNRLEYQCHYNSFQFYESKFPPGFENIPGFNQILENLVIKNEHHTPLAEYSERTEELK